MKKLIPLTVVFAVALVACRPQAPAVTAPTTPALEHLANAKQVMLGLSIPASDVLFQVADNVPTDDAGWARLEATALMLGESGNLLLTGPRDLAQPEWRQFSRELVARSKLAAEAAGRRDVDALLEAGNQIYETCDACHSKYMPAKVAEGATQEPA